MLAVELQLINAYPDECGGRNVSARFFLPSCLAYVMMELAVPTHNFRLSTVPTMKKLILAIGFSLAGILTSIGQAQIIPLTFDSNQSSVDVSIDGNSSSSILSGTATLDLQNSGPPSGNAQLTQLDITADEGLNYSFVLGLVSASTTPGDVTISLVTPGAPGTLAGSSFDQLANMATINGSIAVSDPLGLAGGSQTVDLSTIAISPFDINAITVTQSGNNITVSSSFSVTETTTLGELEVDVTYVATGVVPVVTVLLGDVNLDGVVTFLDIAPFIAILAAEGFQAEADLDQSGVVDFLDISPFITALASQSP